jgi:predicted DNA-binding transcriptional regulator YafY
MSANKLALLRYKTIDHCLQNRFRKWTLDNLVDAVSDALYEYEGIQGGVGKRTIQLDIQNMRSDKLGYSAPIVVIDKKYYAYEDKDYSITKSNVSAHDLEKLGDVLKVLKQFKGFTYFEDISTMVGKIEDKMLRQQSQSKTYIDFEKNELLKGLEWIDPLLQAIKNQDTLDLNYQSFKARKPSLCTVYPYLLKEYRNRWFLLCRISKRKVVQIFALDRIENISINKQDPFFPADDFELENFFDDVIGVTKSLGQKTNRIVLHIDRFTAPYVLTKPIHSSQKTLRRDENGLIVQIDVIWNFELEREILGFGEAMTVLSPRNIKGRIQKRLEMMMENYMKSKEL